MSMNFDNPLTEEQQKIRDSFLKDALVAGDAKTALLNNTVIQREQMSKLAYELEQVVTIEINDIGDIKTMTDGTQYKLSPTGWKKL